MWSASADRRKRRASRNKDAILEVAGQVIAQRGLEQTRFLDISAASGAPVSSLQYYFGSREDLLVAAVEHAVQRELDRLREATSGPAEPRARLSQLTELAVNLRDTPSGGGSLWAEIWRGALHDAELRSLYMQLYEARLAAFRDALQDGIDRGLFPSTLAPYDVALQILALLDGLATPLLIEYPPLDLRKVQQLASDVIDAVLGQAQSLPGIA